MPDRCDGRDKHEQVSERDPFHGSHGRVQSAREGRKRERHDARVELAHARTDADGHDNVPVSARSARALPEAGAARSPGAPPATGSATSAER